ncbi:MAG TPA: hypothetical protein VLC73_18965 [Burkholderiales bacterium]|nr:hypothetical protein [Burkholderiales bacterium]
MALNESHMGDTNGRAERDPRIERLYRDAAREEPPARLDAAILAAARREAGAGPRSLASKLRRWHVPISIAAVVVASVSLVILVQEEQNGQRAGAPAVQAIPAPADQPAAPPDPHGPSAIAKEVMQRPSAAKPTVRREARDDKEVAASSESAARRRPEAAAPASPGAGDVATPAGKPLPQPFLAAPSSGIEERVTHPAEDAVTAGRVASAPTVRNKLQSAPPHAEARRVAPVAGALATKPVEQDRLPVWQGFEKEPPEKWLARIEELKVQGRGAEAQEMLAEFRRRFPEHPLPSSLR